MRARSLPLLAVLFLLTACGGRPSEGEPEAETEAESEPESEAESEAEAEPEAESEAEPEPETETETETETEPETETETETETEPEPEPTPPAQPGFAQPPLPDDATAGWRYVRTHEPFISGLSTQAGPVSAAAVAQYFDDFHATAVHLWADGLGPTLTSWRQSGDVPFVAWTMDNGHSVPGDVNRIPESAGLPGRIGYQIGDEPRDREHMDALEVGAALVEQDDPDALAIFNWTYMAEGLLPAFYDDAIAWGADIFSYDAYSTSREVYPNYAKFARACREHGVPCWRYLDSYWDEGHDNDMSESDIRWDALAGLVFGYVGHTWFIYLHPGESFPGGFPLRSSLFEGATPATMVPTERFWWTAQVNQELKVLGETMGQLDPQDARLAYHWPLIPDWGLPFAIPDGVEPWEPGAGGDPYLTFVGCPEDEPDMDIPIGFFTDGFGGRYVMVQNGRHTGGSWPSDSDLPGVVRLRFDFSSAPAGFDPSILRTLDKHTGEIETLDLEAQTDGTWQLDHLLDPGDAVLLKYADGTPFARRDGA